MKISVTSVPVNNKVSEPFLMPNMTLSIIAGELIKNGYDTEIIDMEKIWFEKLKYLFTDYETEIINDIKKTLTIKKNELYRIGKKIIKNTGINETDIFAISFTDLIPEDFSLTIPYITSIYLKKINRKLKTVIGGYELGYYAHMDIMRKFKVYDYAVYSKNGAKSLISIIKKIKGEKTELYESIERKKNLLINHTFKNKNIFSLTPYYNKEILYNYSYTDTQILSRYNSNPIAKKITNNKKYTVVPYIFELYCPNKCAFCEQNVEIPNLKSISQIIDELSYLKELGVNGIYFVNSSFNNHYKYTMELCDKMIKYKLNIKWMDCASFVNIDKYLLKKMKDSGAVKLTWGVESASSKMLKYINKNTTIEKISEFIKYADELGITNHIELIAGLPYEDKKDIEATVNFIKEHSKYIDIYTLNSFYLYHNSYFFLYPEKFGLNIIRYPDFKKMNFFPKGSRTSVGRFSYMFDEINGLKWKEKNKQIINSTMIIASAIQKYSNLNKFGNEHIHLLFMLYDKLGYNKKLIKKILSILTRKFMPYNLDFYLTDFQNICHKHEETRILLPKKESLSII